jgi:protein-disulfide isomerase
MLISICGFVVFLVGLRHYRARKQSLLQINQIKLDCEIMIKPTQFLASVFLAVAATVTASVPANAEISDKDFSASIEKYLQSDSGVAKIGSALERYFQKKQEEAAKQQENQAKAELEEQFKNPVKIEVGKSPVKGPATAKVTIVEFSDFQCPYCKRGRDTMDEVQKAYPNDVKVTFKHFPLSFHKEAEPAAKASWAAQQQGKFWEFHDALFNNQDKLGADFYLATARELKLDEAKFKADMASEAAAKQIKEDSEIASNNGIQGTPGFFVNGVAVRGAYPPAHFKQIIDRWLNKGAAGTK